MSRTIQVTFDAHDPETLCEVAVPASGWNSASAAQDPDGDGPRLFFQLCLD